MKMTKAEARKHIEVLEALTWAEEPEQLSSIRAAAKFLRDAVEAEPVAITGEQCPHDPMQVHFTPAEWMRLATLDAGVGLFTSQLEGE